MLILKRVLLTPPLRGKWAWLVGLAAVAVPTLIRAAVQGSVSTGLFVTYIPFVLLVVLLLRPGVAALLVVTFAIVADFFFIEPYFALAAAANDLFGVGAFLITSP